MSNQILQNIPPTNRKRWLRPGLILANLLLILVVTALGPEERTLGATVRIIYLHGAWVDTGKILFGLAALSGLAALLPLERLPHFFSRVSWPQASLALGRAGLFFWLTYLPMSMYVMQVTWGGFFFDEPRWRTPFMLAVVGTLLQVGLTFLNAPRLTALANLLFGAALWGFLGTTGNVLHPNSPIFTSTAIHIQIFFLGLLLAVLVLGAQLTAWVLVRQKTIRPPR